MLQRRLISSWAEVMDDAVVQSTGNIFVSNQTLVVEIINSAIQAELMMKRKAIVERLNRHVGARVVVDVKIT